jgi:hypothetical protein
MYLYIVFVSSVSNGRGDVEYISSSKSTEGSFVAYLGLSFRTDLMTTLYSVRGALHRLDVGTEAVVSEVHAATIFRVELCKMSRCLCMYVFVQQTHGRPCHSSGG